MWHQLVWASDDDAILAAITAAISLFTMGVLVRVMPSVFAIPDALADHRFRELLENAPDAVMQVDSQGKIVIANRTAELMFGYSHKELIGSSVDLLVPQAARGVHPHQREQFVHAGAPRLMYEGGVDRHGLRKDGTEFSVEIGLNPVRTEAGVYISAIIRDVTDRKQLERELERERALRGQRVEVLARLAADLAHEIKNPLAIIHARASDLSELATHGETLPAVEVEKTCASIVKTTERAIRVIRGVEALAHEGSHDPMQKTDVRGLIEQSMDLLRTRYETHGIALEAEIADDLPLVECREVQIEQILINLLTNAFDAIDGSESGQRWVKVRATMRPAWIQFAGVQAVRIEVIDSGPGIVAENRGRLMETFFTTKPKGSGIGIGLSVSRTIAEDHGGTLELLNSDGPTCFRLTLPVLAAGDGTTTRAEGGPE
jgi:PAS domain S-box-containing protein